MLSHHCFCSNAVTAAVCIRRPFNCIVMHSDNQLVAVGCWDATVKLYDTFNKTRKAVQQFVK